MFSRLRTAFANMFALARHSCYCIYTIQTRERRQLQEEFSQIRGLMPLIMKQRNGYRWTREDREQIRAQLRSLSRLSPYLIPLLLPGGFLALPIMAWWLDRRRQKRLEETQRPRTGQ